MIKRVYICNALINTDTQNFYILLNVLGHRGGWSPGCCYVVINVFCVVFSALICSCYSNVVSCVLPDYLNILVKK